MNNIDVVDKLEQLGVVGVDAEWPRSARSVRRSLGDAHLEGGRFVNYVPTWGTYTVR